MTTINHINDLEECRSLWQNHWPQRCLFDLWPVRKIFLEAFQRQPLFLKVENHGQIDGLLALTWIAEEGYFGHFPGETWTGKTWLEQNRIMASSPLALTELLAAIPGPFYLRYLKRCRLIASECQQKDETNYALRPCLYGYSFPEYLKQFTGKNRKKLLREVDKLKKSALSFRINHYPDVETMFRLNLKAYSKLSYFHDHRFLAAFEKLAEWLRDHQLLRLITVLIKGEVAAIDLSAVWRNTCTVLAGGTNPDFPGIAKLINLYHIEWACSKKMENIDFLCGDFNWKERFHLNPRPLYKLDNRQATTLPIPNWQNIEVQPGRKAHA